MDEYNLVQDEIKNIDFYEQIKEIINCIICLNIIEDPVQCSICKYNFCKECINKLGRCPMGCQNYEIIPGIYCKELISNIIIKCSKCGLDVNYENIGKHKEEDCPKIDFKKKYLELKNKYELMINNLFFHIFLPRHLSCYQWLNGGFPPFPQARRRLRYIFIYHDSKTAPPPLSG